MLAHGDIESVNLGTGERHRRVAGNGESWLESLGIPGLRQVDPADLAEYERAMREAVPAIIEAVKMRLRLAVEARQRILFYRENVMHYRNGREAKNGDKVIQLGMSGPAAGQVQAVGVLYGAVPGQDYCNGSIAPVQQAVIGACLCDCLHVDDVAAMLAEKGLDKRPTGK
jgi:hypothetical protein